jgi:hypothetical protein
MTPPLIYLAAGILLGCIGATLLGVVCAKIFMRGLRHELSVRLQNHEQSLRSAFLKRETAPSLAPDLDVARITQHLQQAIQVEIEYLAQRQLERDEIFAQKQRRWQAEQEARHANDIRDLLHALCSQGGKGKADTAATRHSSSPRIASASIESPPSVVSARPPELVHTPLPRPEIEHVAEQSELELSDAEIDALPPELPHPVKSRKRLPFAPAKPPFRGI